MSSATYTPGQYPVRLNKRESKVVETAVASSNGALKVADEPARLALTPSDGDLVVQLDNHTLYVYDSDTSVWIAVVGGGGGSPGGGEGQVQFNSSSTFAADPKFKWDNSAKQVNLNGLKIEPLASETLLDNQSNIVVFTFAHAVERFMVVEYSITRGSESRIGHIKIATNGSTATLDDIHINTADVGVTFSAGVNGANVELRYTTTSSGISATMKYSKRKWI
jgi:hypothetical protein